MLRIRNIFCFILLPLIIATTQINLYFTDAISKSEKNDALQHDCLRVNGMDIFSFMTNQVMSFCMSESSSQFNIQTNDLFPSFTFAELAKQNISSQQLYLWSAPIDIAERYQYYLNQLSTTNDLSLSEEIFYNCTLPRFGSICQYELDYHHPNHSSLYYIIHDFYYYNKYQPNNLTCYIHLLCDRGPNLGCLDWSEICDGHMNCLNGGVDEEHCWQLEINECQDNEYRCNNGQCIPKAFVRDDRGFYLYDCIDGTDEFIIYEERNHRCHQYGLELQCDEMTCSNSFLTSSCLPQRYELISQTLFTIKEDNISDDCWSAFKCSLHISDEMCDEFDTMDIYISIIEKTCSDIMYIPSVPLLFGDIYFAYLKNNSRDLNDKNFLYLYMCHNNSLYDDYFVNISKVSFNNTVCYRSISWILDEQVYLWEHELFKYRYGYLLKYNPFFNYSSAICNRSNMYQCVHSSKCISIYRLMDSVYDCPHFDDEDQNRFNNMGLTEHFKNNYYTCPSSKKYIPLLWIENGKCDCGYDEHDRCEDEDLFLFTNANTISFYAICDGFTDLLPINIEGQSETDETECEQWPCHNIYTHCDGIWQCINGRDELGCDLLSLLDCSSNHHICVSPHTNQLMCLAMEKGNDGNVDCLGATDEPKLCRRKNSSDRFNDFYCMNDSSETCIHPDNICDGHNDCIHGDDEQFCKIKELVGMWSEKCQLPYKANRSDINQIICEGLEIQERSHDKDFLFDGFTSEDAFLSDILIDGLGPEISTIENSIEYQSRCHRGLDVRVWLDNENNVTTRTCLCPPSYYGNVCQYQNERVSLTLLFIASPTFWQIPLVIMVSLIDDDNERIIHSYEQLTYWYTQDCATKFHIYLLYATRPKNPMKRYAIHVDIYEKVSLGYYGSVLMPIAFPFLPVYRLSLMINIPRSNDSIESCSNHQCIHGRCIRYLNNSKDETFCQCNRGWSGRYCTIPYDCMCSFDSLCIGISARNKSVCVCPIHRLGSRCLLIDTVCQTGDNSTCQNGGQCLPNDEYTSSMNMFTCICPRGFHGTRCETPEAKIILSFEKDIGVPQSILIHFIEVFGDIPPTTITTFKTTPIQQNSVIIYWSKRFHLVFVEFFKSNYYFVGTEKSSNLSAIIIKTINSSDRCRHIIELFNKTFLQLHLLRRIKYYHLPCEKYSPYLSCFYDEVHLCLCYDYHQQRLANCFTFNHNMTYDCSGDSECQNGAQCFQDSLYCSRKTMCLCSPCFYGTQCQFTANGFGSSLDAILGYHILPHVSLTQQPIIIQQCPRTKI